MHAQVFGSSESSSTGAGILSKNGTFAAVNGTSAGMKDANLVSA